MKLWREVVEGKIPVRDKIKIHLIVHRASNLKNFVSTGKAWLTVLNSCTPANETETADFEKFLDGVNGFVKWAEAGLAEMQMFGTQEMLIDGFQELLADPELGPSLLNKLNRSARTAGA